MVFDNPDRLSAESKGKTENELLLQDELALLEQSRVKGLEGIGGRAANMNILRAETAGADNYGTLRENPSTLYRLSQARRPEEPKKGAFVTDTNIKIEEDDPEGEFRKLASAEVRKNYREKQFFDDSPRARRAMGSPAMSPEARKRAVNKFFVSTTTNASFPSAKMDNKKTQDGGSPLHSSPRRSEQLRAQMDTDMRFANHTPVALAPPLDPNKRDELELRSLIEAGLWTPQEILKLMLADGRALSEDLVKTLKEMQEELHGPGSAEDLFLEDVKVQKTSPWRDLIELLKKKTP